MLQGARGRHHQETIEARFIVPQDFDWDAWENEAPEPLAAPEEVEPLAPTTKASPTTYEADPDEGRPTADLLAELDDEELDDEELDDDQEEEDQEEEDQEEEEEEESRPRSTAETLAEWRASGRR